MQVWPMQLFLTNTLTREKQPFHPLDPKNVRVYYCGPTVYSYAHVGNARAAVSGDVLRRVLNHLYPKVTFVSNITDIDDRIMHAAREQNVAIENITLKFEAIYNEDMAALNIQKPDAQPRATAYVPQMIALIEALLKNGHAYEAEGHVLFNVPSYKDYGQLSGRNRDEQIAGARVDVAPYKKDPADFVLWKPSTPDQPGWPSPWGRGRPGWHIECSAMAKSLLGDTFDIHGGGLDLTFPHHENEIAQSCCANHTKSMANFWLHNGFLRIDSEKMSKSLGNVWLVHDMLQKFSGEAIRFALLSTHYRQPLDITEDLLQQAEKTIHKFYEATATVEASVVDAAVLQALCDDLNTAAAYARLHALYAARDYAGLKASAQLMGLLITPAQIYLTNRRTRVLETLDVAEVEKLIDARMEARANKNWAESDRIRDRLVDMGITLMDSAHGTEWRV